jgi:hypothetical protein
LHPHPKLVHFREVLEYKLYSIHDSVSISARVKRKPFNSRATLQVKKHRLHKGL